MVVSASSVCLLFSAIVFTAATTCPCNFIQVGRSCIYLSSFQTTFIQAFEYCDLIDGILARIRNNARNRVFTNVLAAHAVPDQDFWIGATNLEDRIIWRELSGRPVPTGRFSAPLVSGTETCPSMVQPLPHPSENCAMLSVNDNGTYVWKSEQCNSLAFFICVRKAPQAPPTPQPTPAPTPHPTQPTHAPTLHPTQPTHAPTLHSTPVPPPI